MRMGKRTVLLHCIPLSFAWTHSRALYHRARVGKHSFCAIRIVAMAFIRRGNATNQGRIELGGFGPAFAVSLGEMKIAKPIGKDESARCSTWPQPCSSSR